MPNLGQKNRFWAFAVPSASPPSPGLNNRYSIMLCFNFSKKLIFPKWTSIDVVNCRINLVLQWSLHLSQDLYHYSTLSLYTGQPDSTLAAVSSRDMYLSVNFRWVSTKMLIFWRGVHPFETTSLLLRFLESCFIWMSLPLAFDALTTSVCLLPICIYKLKNRILW